MTFCANFKIGETNPMKTFLLPNVERKGGKLRYSNFEKPNISPSPPHTATCPQPNLYLLRNFTYCISTLLSQHLIALILLDLSFLKPIVTICSTNLAYSNQCHLLLASQAQEAASTLSSLMILSILSSFQLDYLMAS